jgi:hypothetical protein
MNDIGFAEYLLKKYRESIASRHEVITTGSITNMEQYKTIVGECTGLSLAIEEILVLLKNMEKLDD